MNTLNRLWWFSLLIKLILTAFLPLFSDETYYWQWSHHLQLSYFDHPPMIAWVLSLGHIFENMGFAARWPSVVLGHMCLFVWILIAKEFLKDRKALLWFSLCLLVMPLGGVSWLIATPDVPLVFFWSLATWQTIKLIDQQISKNYLFLGLWLGLGFSSKYQMVLFALFFLPWAIFSCRKLVNSKGILLTTMTGLIGSLPVLIWNATNEWVSFKFQLNHGLGGGAWQASWTYEYIFGQIFLVSPFIFYICAKQLSQIKSIGPKESLLYFLSFGPFLFFIWSSFSGHVEANWSLVSHPALLLIAFIGAKESVKWPKYHFAFWSLLFALIFYSGAVSNFLKIKKFDEYKQYSLLAQGIEDTEQLFADSFQMASQLSFQTKKPIYKLNGSRRIDFYDSLEQSLPKNDEYYYITKTGWTLPDWAQKANHITVKRTPITESFDLLQINKERADEN